MNYKIPKSLRHIGSLYVKAILLLSLLYILWNLLRVFIPLTIFLIVRRSLVSVLALGYLGFFPMLLTVRWKTYMSLIILALTIPMCFYSILVAFVRGDEYIKDTVRMNDRSYHITIDWPLGHDWAHYKFYDCNFMDNGCESRIVGYQAGPRELIFDHETGFVHGFIGGGKPEFIYDTLLRKYYYPDNYAGLSRDGYYYWVTKSHSQHLSQIVIYRCNFSVEQDCEFLPFRYTTEATELSLKEIDFHLDESEQVIYFYIKDELIYTYGEHGICYADECEISEWW